MGTVHPSDKTVHTGRLHKHPSLLYLREPGQYIFFNPLYPVIPLCTLQYLVPPCARKHFSLCINLMQLFFYAVIVLVPHIH